ncbi:MAG TPA: HpcH/HpaI aldolase/citrate lyase family protein [Candidatus Saccharimonadales bacterium]|nr:HpcH/HpaI aldolase/citrate lyase family protein [Candidatus Saccharimonadales bacterium]
MIPILYTPATRKLSDLVHLMNGGNDQVRRLAICTEDSIGEDEVGPAIANIKAALKQLDPGSPTEVFVRLRDHDATMEAILDLKRVEHLSGFIIPKAHPTGFTKYAHPITRKSERFKLLPIVEHRSTPDSTFRRRLLETFLDYRGHIDCVRIGGNDLLGHQALRRAEGVTIYDTVVGDLIASIVNEFRGIGEFEVTAPVVESFAPSYDFQLKKELRRSIANGLFGQTVIHPRHLGIILEAYRVGADDYTSAKEILGSTKAVLGKAGRMDEKATHYRWALRTMARAELFGSQM